MYLRGAYTSQVIFRKIAWKALWDLDPYECWKSKLEQTQTTSFIPYTLPEKKHSLWKYTGPQKEMSSPNHWFSERFVSFKMF